jgi:thiol-disulfide isomerase/thioredoxin
MRKIYFRCGPCKVLGNLSLIIVDIFNLINLIEPRLEKVLTNYNKKVQDGDKQIKIAKVDIDNLAELSSKYDVQAVPTGK